LYPTIDPLDIQNLDSDNTYEFIGNLLLTFLDEIRLKSTEIDGIERKFYRGIRLFEKKEYAKAKKVFQKLVYKLINNKEGELIYRIL
jgi:hypothetical protein